MSQNTEVNVRSKFLEFFQNRGHKHLPSANLSGDDSLLFVNSGMVQFKKYFTGEQEAPFKSVCTVQKCVRAGGKHNDLENVGYTNRHHTFFEMLGNFSFGVYGKKEAIGYAYEFIINELKIDPKRLYYTVYHTDEESFKIWAEIVDETRIIKINSNDNWWSMGSDGPCGPCTEIFYDWGEGVEGDKPGTAGEDGARYTEIWNIVFMEHEQEDGKIIRELPQKCIDTGMGLERINAVLNGVYDNYDTPVFTHLRNKLKNLADLSEVATKVIADHFRCIAFLIADGVSPSSEGRGYVARRIIRRAFRYADGLLNATQIETFCKDIIEKCYAGFYDEIHSSSTLIEKTILQEFASFSKVVERGMKYINRIPEGGFMSGTDAFMLHDALGFTVDMTEDYLSAKNATYDKDEFAKLLQEQQSKAKDLVANCKDLPKNVLNEILALPKTEKMYYQDFKTIETEILGIWEVKNGFVAVCEKSNFYPESGGQVGDVGLIDGVNINDTKVFDGRIVHFLTQNIKESGNVLLEPNVETRHKSACNHSATHLLNKVLNTLFDGIFQKGSYVGPDKLRFDFTFDRPLSADEIEKIESNVNELIQLNSPANVSETDFESAKTQGVTFLPWETYGNNVRVVKLGSSAELCGGIHVQRTGDIGLFLITSQSSVASGVRRLEAMTGSAAIAKMREVYNEIGDICGRYKIEEANGAVTSIIAKLENDAKENAATVKKYQQYYLQGLPRISKEGYNVINVSSSKIPFKDAVNILKGLTPASAEIFIWDNGQVVCITNGEIDAKEVVRSYSPDIKGGGKGTFFSGKKVT